MSLVTLIPEPDNKDNVVENGHATDKKDGLKSSADKSNLSESQQVSKPTAVKKGRISSRQT